MPLKNLEIFSIHIFIMFRSLVKNCPEFIRTSMLTFFNNTADDLGHTIQNLQEVSFYIMLFPNYELGLIFNKMTVFSQGRYCYLRGTHLKTSTSLFYINDVVLPTLTAMFDHLAACEYGSDLLCKFSINYYIINLKQRILYTFLHF